MLKISALTGKGVHRLLPALAGRDRGLPPAGADPEGQRGHPRGRSRRSPAPHGARVLYATAGRGRPADVHAVRQQELPPSYLRYLERQLREEFGLGATPMKLRVRRRSQLTWSFLRGGSKDTEMPRETSGLCNVFGTQVVTALH